MKYYTRDDIVEATGDEELLFADGLDEAIIGYVQSFHKIVVLYDFDKCISVLMNEGLSEEEALEHFDYNIAGSYVGEYTPAFAFTNLY